MGVAEFKLAAVAAIFLTGVGGGLVSLRLDLYERSEAIFSLGSVLASGIFLGAGLLHMLPDSVRAFRETVPLLDFPLAFLQGGILRRASPSIQVCTALWRPGFHGAPGNLALEFELQEDKTRTCL
jgi:hypothetical protein